MQLMFNKIHNMWNQDVFRPIGLSRRLQVPDGIDPDYMQKDFIVADCPVGNAYALRELSYFKMRMLDCVKTYFSKTNEPFDEFNGLPPTRINEYMGYEFGTLFLWGVLVSMIQEYDTVKKLVEGKKFYTRYAKLISKVFKKYPVTTSTLLYELNLHHPDNRFEEFTNMDEANFDSDTQETWNNEKADEFKKWLFSWCDNATDKDKMRVAHWFETKKSHKQIFSEIARVAGNEHKFNSRLALFVERLLSNDNVDYFFEKTGFDSKEDLLMAYFEKINLFDEESKRSFIKKYFLKGENE